MKMAFALLIGLALLSPEPAEADDGGLTFDFAAISGRRFGSLGGQTLDPNQWKGGYCYIHSRDVAADDPRRTAVRNAVDCRIENGVATVVKKPSLVEICRDAELAKNVSGGMTQVVRLPDANGGTYRLSVVYRMRHELGAFGGALVTPIREKTGVRKGMSAPGDTEPQLKVCRFDNVWSEWVTWSREFRVSAGCDALNVVLRIDGIGELKFKDFSVSRVVNDNPITLKASPADWLDGTFAFSAGQCALPVWQWKQNDPSAKYEAGRFTFVLTLPKGYAFVDSPAVRVSEVTRKVLPKGGTEYRLPASDAYGGCHVGSAYASWPVLSMLIRAEAGAGRGEMRLYAEYEGQRVSDETITKVFVIPALRALVPKRYDNGFYLGGPYAEFGTKEGREGFADMFTSAGATWVVQMRPDDETREVWRARGVRRITPQYAHCANGFHVGDPKGRPVQDRYVASGGTHPEIANATCPLAVSGESDYFRNDTLPRLKRFLEGCDGLWANWEPYMFAGNGCFCNRCRAAFAAFVGVSDGEMEKDWPQELAFGRKWHAQALRFRSVEHGKLVKTVDRHVRAFTGGEKSVGFIPGIAWCEMAGCWRTKNLAAEVQAIDYAGSLRWIDPWGPYPWWDAETPYVKGEGRFLDYFLVAKDTRAQVDRDYGGSAPKLMAFPHGVQCCTCFTQPESVTLSLLSFFFNRWESAIVYAFPKGCDARYWQAFAKATTIAAKCEDYVYDGRRCDSEVKLTLDPARPYPPPAKDPGGDYLPNDRDVPLLQHVAYEKDGRMIVAVFNFADRDTAHFTLTAQGGRVVRSGTVGASRCKVFGLQLETVCKDGLVEGE